MAVDRCARCGRTINDSGATWLPTTDSELCSWCLTGHEPGWLDYGPDPPRFTRRQVAGIALLWIVSSGGFAWAMVSMIEDDAAVWVSFVLAWVIVAVFGALEYRRSHTQR